MKTRLVDTEMWLSEIEDIVKSGHEVSLNVTGESMAPFLRHARDKVMLAPFTSPAQIGDILLYKRKSGEYILHRVVKCDGKKLWLAGDAQKVVEGPLDDECVIAKVTKANRKGKWISKGDSEWDFFEKRWIKTVPYRDKLLKIRNIIKK